MMVIDAHAHLFPDALAERAMAQLGAMYGVEPVRLPTLSGVLAEMQAHGIARAAVLQVATKPEQVGPINTWALELAGDPRLAPFGALHAAQSPDDLDAEVERLLAGGIRGIKLQPYFQRFDPLTPEGLALLRRVGDRMVVLIHGGEEMIPVRPLWTTPQALIRLHEAVPEVRLIVGHLGGYLLWEDALEHLAGRDVYFDISFTLHKCPRDLALRIIEKHGCDRIVWGSDFPWAAMDWSPITQLGLSQDEVEAILGGNMTRLLGP